MITYACNFTLRRLTGLIRQSAKSQTKTRTQIRTTASSPLPLPTGLSTAETHITPLNPPAQTLKLHSHPPPPTAWTESSLRNKIERAKALRLDGRDGHVMTMQY